MKDQKESKQGGVNSVVAAVAGAVVGAGIAAAAVALSDEKNRKTVAKAASRIKDDVAGRVDKAQNKLAEDKAAVQKVVSSAKESLHKTTKEVNNAVKSL